MRGWNVLWISVGLLFAACSPPAPQVSVEMQAEIDAIKAELHLLEEQESTQRQAFVAEQERLTVSNQVAQAKIETLQQDILRMEAELAAPTPQPPPPPKENGLDQLRLSNNTSFVAEVKSIQDGQVHLLRDGEEQSGPVSAIQSIQFRSVPPDAP